MQGLRIAINQAQTDMHELQYWKVLRLHEVRISHIDSLVQDRRLHAC